MDNRYFRVTAPTTVYKVVGLSPSHAYVGASQLLGTVYEERLLQPGDEIHCLFGGTFALANAEVFEIDLQINTKHPFEKSGGPPQRCLPSPATTTEITRNQATPVGSYRTIKTWPIMAPGRFVGRGIHSIVQSKED